MMISKLLLVGSAIFSYGSNLTLKAPERVYNPVNDNNFRYFADLFSYSTVWQDNTLTIQAFVNSSAFLTLPDLSFNYFYFGDFYFYHDIDALTYYIYGNDSDYDDHVQLPPSEYFPFSNTNSNFNIYNKSFFMQLGVPFTYELFFIFKDTFSNDEREIALLSFRDNFGFSNDAGISDYVQTIAYDNYNQGYADGLAISDGTWLGQMIFGTIGGMVGFLFAISDFEVLGVSIMSIITLFVAISILILLIKVLK